MSLNLVFTDAAKSTFEDLKDQIYNRWGANSEDRFVKRVDVVLNSIVENPFIYQAADEDPNVRKAFVHKNCSFLYEISETYIVVLFFWDNRQEPIF